MCVCVCVGTVQTKSSVCVCVFFFWGGGRGRTWVSKNLPFDGFYLPFNQGVITWYFRFGVTRRERLGCRVAGFGWRHRVPGMFTETSASPRLSQGQVLGRDAGFQALHS